MRPLAVLAAILAVILAFLAIVVPAPAVHAEGARRVAVFPVDDDVRLYARLMAELRSQGFEVAEVSSDATTAAADTDPFEHLDVAARATRAALALRLSVAPAAVRLWIANTATGKRLYREAAIETTAHVDAAVVSLWAVEAVRASGIAPDPQPVLAVVTPPSPAPPPPPRFAFYVAPAVALSPGGLGPSAQLVIGGRRLLSPHAGAELAVVLPTLSTNLELPAGGAAVSRGVATAGGFLSTGTFESRWSVQLGAGAALTVVRVGGVGADGLVGRSDYVAGGGPYARAGVALKVSGAFRLRADATGGVAFPRPVVMYGDQRVAAWGRPWLATALGCEAIF